MEPFVPEQDQRITHERPAHGGKGDGGRSNTPLLVVLVAALLAMGGALVAVVYSQQQSFDALQQNFQALQGQLATPPAAEARAEPEAPQTPEAPVEPATPGAAANTVPAVDPAALNALNNAVERLQQQIGQLESRVGQLDRQLTNLPAGAGGDTRALGQTTNRLSGEVATLRKEILDMKLALNDSDGTTKEWQSKIGQRLTTAESELLTLRQSSRDALGNVSLADAIHQLQQEMLRLKRAQKKLHPYYEG